MNKRFAVLRKRVAQVAIPAGLGAMALPAFAVDPADGLAAIGTLTTGQAAYGPVLYGLAIASVAIMVAVKWIKRSRGAA